jgi:DNA polymerase IIIc chi subunit
MSAPPHQLSNESVREVTPIIISSSTVTASNERHLRINLARRSGQVNIPRTPRFDGRCDELKGHVYDATDIRQADQFIKTTW